MKKSTILLTGILTCGMLVSSMSSVFETKNITIANSEVEYQNALANLEKTLTTKHQELLNAHKADITAIMSGEQKVGLPGEFVNAESAYNKIQDFYKTELERISGKSVENNDLLFDKYYSQGTDLIIKSRYKLYEEAEKQMGVKFNEQKQNYDKVGNVTDTTNTSSKEISSSSKVTDNKKAYEGKAVNKNDVKVLPKTSAAK